MENTFLGLLHSLVFVSISDDSYSKTDRTHTLKHIYYTVEMSFCRLSQVVDMLNLEKEREKARVTDVKCTDTHTH